MTTLTDYGLVVGDRVRFQRKPGGNWTEANVRGINKDGSVDLGTPTGIRAIMPNRLEVKRSGPKGGIQWHPVLATANSPES